MLLFLPLFSSILTVVHCIRLHKGNRSNHSFVFSTHCLPPPFPSAWHVFPRFVLVSRLFFFLMFDRLFSFTIPHLRLSNNVSEAEVDAGSFPPDFQVICSFLLILIDVFSSFLTIFYLFLFLLWYLVFCYFNAGLLLYLHFFCSGWKMKENAVYFSTALSWFSSVIPYFVVSRIPLLFIFHLLFSYLACI